MNLLPIAVPEALILAPIEVEGSFKVQRAVPEALILPPIEVKGSFRSSELSRMYL